MLSIGIDASLLPPDEPPVMLLATIFDRELLWDDRDDCPVWPEGEPLAYSFEPDGGIHQEPLVDVNRLPSWVRQGKVLDCTHRIRPTDHYVTLLAVNRDLCLDCAEALS